ncbi:60S ribosomal protein L14 [Homalodisca vitripennis]|uniref:60S ribosomal protein L14 n=1 Tax=Homalodisca vitripennis TaxID=197043 RepID=UPI001EEB6B0A|nr:60S ribosomal protein L14 [Homalodisca vitripennis]
MPFKRFVETGRVAYIAEGQHKGKLCSIVDVINQTRALIDGPETGVPRGQIRLNQLHLTKFRIRFPYTGSTRVVRKAWKDGKIDEKWKESVWYQKVEAKKRRAELTDFDRFRLRYARRMRNKIRSRVFFKLRATKGGRPKGDKKAKAVKKVKKAAPPKKK